jgi:hypothetical protein
MPCQTQPVLRETSAVPSAGIHDKRGIVAVKTPAKPGQAHLTVLITVLLIVGANPALPELARGLMLIAIGLFAYGVLRKPDHSRAPLVSASILLGSMAPLTIYDLSFALVEGATTYSFVIIPVSAMVGFAVARSFPPGEFTARFERVVLFLGLASLPGFALYLLDPSFTDILIGYVHPVTQVESRSAIFQNFQFNPWPVYRNAGFASEPGFFAFYLNLALAVHLRGAQQSIWRIAAYIFLVTTTLSTTGFIALAANLLFGFRSRYLPTVGIVMLLSLPVTVPFFQSHVEERITSGVAFESRGLSSRAALDFVLDNPGGVGANEYDRLYRIDPTIGSFDAYTHMAIRYGILGLLGLLAVIVMLAMQSPVLGAVMFVSLLTSPIWFIPAIGAFFFLRRDEQSLTARRPQPRSRVLVPAGAR